MFAGQTLGLLYDTINKCVLRWLFFSLTCCFTPVTCIRMEPPSSFDESSLGKSIQLVSVEHAQFAVNRPATVSHLKEEIITKEKSKRPKQSENKKNTYLKTTSIPSELNEEKHPKQESQLSIVQSRSTQDDYLQEQEPTKQIIISSEDNETSCDDTMDDIDDAILIGSVEALEQGQNADEMMHDNRSITYADDIQQNNRSIHIQSNVLGVGRTPDKKHSPLPIQQQKILSHTDRTAVPDCTTQWLQVYKEY